MSIRVSLSMPSGYYNCSNPRERCLAFPGVIFYVPGHQSCKLQNSCRACKLSHRPCGSTARNGRAPRLEPGYVKQKQARIGTPIAKRHKAANMDQVKVGMVVFYQGGFYLYTTGKKLGEYKLLPITVDETRENVPVTAEMELQDYFRRPTRP